MQLIRIVSGLVGCVCAGLLPAAATGRNLSGLLKNNPFGVASASVEKPGEPPSQWELRGVIREPDGYLLNVYDAQTKRSVWVKEGEAGRALFIKNFNQASGTAVAEIGGRSIPLALKSARPASSVRVSSTLVASLATQLQGKVSWVAVAPPESEVRRLADVADQVRELREQRRKAAATNSKT